MDELLDEFTQSSLEPKNPTAASAFAGAAANTAVVIEINRVALWLKYLGDGDAATPTGAIEALGKHLDEKLDALASSFSEIS
jgi:hypothetical protein